MGDLVQWLGEQLDADAAEIAGPYAARAWHARDCESLPDPDAPTFPCNCGVPERLLREVDAKRGIVRAYEAAVAAFNDSGPAMANYDRLVGSVSSLRGSLERLAAVYADRPGYRESWRP